MKRHTVGAALLITGAIGFGTFELARHQDRLEGRAEREIDVQLVRDGFSAVNNSSYPHRSTISFEQFVVGACQFSYVDAKVRSVGGHIVDVYDYTTATGQLGSGKFAEEAGTVQFQNRHQLQAILPDINCFPTR